ncbi:hypothetical protein SKAU_G00248270 [Synaphobranchus kaupii]|uniref:Uncharacterized protein n=1 Tax=Synaphobranchus kaupii TaxID=118154 RepID=A0A9Q1F2S1_SYNKA|nr:hypothetical protein SKAU_G00248270 [Synaphobranchus kaupii]
MLAGRLAVLHSAGQRLPSQPGRGHRRIQAQEWEGKARGTPGFRSSHFPFASRRRAGGGCPLLQRGSVCRSECTGSLKRLSQSATLKLAPLPKTGVAGAEGASPLLTSDRRPQSVVVPPRLALRVGLNEIPPDADLADRVAAATGARICPFLFCGRTGVASVSNYLNAKLTHINWSNR